MMNKSVMVMLAAGALITGHAFADTDYYVQSLNAKIWQESSFKSKVIAEVGKGQLLPSTGTENNWVKVRYQGQDGYVPTLLLSTHPPLGKNTLIGSDESEIKEGVRRRASAYTSAAAARGLSREDRERADVEEGTNYGAVRAMESMTVTADEVSQFARGVKP